MHPGGAILLVKTGSSHYHENDYHSPALHEGSATHSPAHMTASTLTARHIASRTAVALLGGYVFTWGIVALGVAGLYTAGMEFHDAEHLSYIIGLLVFLTAFLVAFATHALRRTALALVGGGAAMTALAWWLQSLLV